MPTPLPEGMDEFDILISEPDPDLVAFLGDEKWSHRYLSRIRDEARAEKERLRAAKRAREAAEASAAAEPPAGS